jgi:hypothetical protein
MVASNGCRFWKLQSLDYEVECLKGISLDYIAQMNREYFICKFEGQSLNIDLKTHLIKIDAFLFYVLTK